MAKTVLHVPPAESGVVGAEITQTITIPSTVVEVVTLTDNTSRVVSADDATVVVFATAATPTLIAAGQQGPPGPPGAGVAETTWVEYAANWSSPPTLLTTVAQGQVWQYTYNGGSVLYRVIGSSPYTDAFYSTFDGATASDLVTERSMAVA